MSKKADKLIRAMGGSSWRFIDAMYGIGESTVNNVVDEGYVTKDHHGYRQIGNYRKPTLKIILTEKGLKRQVQLVEEARQAAAAALKAEMIALRKCRICGYPPEPGRYSGDVKCSNEKCVIYGLAIDKRVWFELNHSVR